MIRRYPQIMYTDSVKQTQQHYGTRRQGEKMVLDYPNKKRLKIAARTEVFDIGERLDLSQQLAVPGYKARIERAFVFHVEAFDWNCPQHITPRLTEQEWAGLA